MFVSLVLGSLSGLGLVVAQMQAGGWVVGIENHKSEQVEAPAADRTGQRSLELAAVFEAIDKASGVVAQHRLDKLMARIGLVARIGMIVVGKAGSATAERLLWSEIRGQDASHHDRKNTTDRF